MSDDFQQQAAIAMKKAKQQSEKRQKVSIYKEKDNIQKEIEYQKTKLLQSVENNDRARIQKYFEKLTKLRARQVALRINDEKEKNDPKIIDGIIKEYYWDCVQLATSVDNMISV